MIFDFEQSRAQGALQLAALKCRLYAIAARSPLDSTQQRDQLENDSVAFLRGQIFDAVGGGFYWDAGDAIQFDGLQNALVAEYLLLADKVFYHGELSFQAMRQLDYLCHYCWDKAHGYFSASREFERNAMPFVCRGKELRDWLSDNELQILSGLLAKKTIGNEQFYTLDYRCSLKEAAATVAIEFKHAQILADSLLKKLSARLAHRYSTDRQLLTLDVAANCQILSALTQAILWYQADHYRPIAARLAQTLCEHLSFTENSACLSVHQRIEWCATLLDYGQVDFQSSRLVCLTQILAQRQPLLSEIDQFHRQLLARIKQLLAYFHPSTQAPDNERWWLDPTLDLPPSNLRIEALARGPAGHARREDLLRRYDANLFLFND